MISFRKFFHNRFEKIKQKSGMPLWSEMAVHVNDYSIQMPIPKMVGVILNHVPNKDQALVLKWIFSEGLRQASIGRRAICEHATKRLGRPVAQEEVFSKVAHKNDKYLAKLYEEELEDLWMKKYEPKTFPVKEKGRNTKLQIKFSDLNKIKQSWMGDDFTFGLTGGLMEWIEEGRGWSPHKGHHATYDKHGPDLSLSTDKDENDEFKSNGLFKHSDERPHQKAVVLGRSGLTTPFRPAENIDPYKDAIEELKIHTLEKFNKLIKDHESGKEFDNEDDRNLASGLAQLKKDGKIVLPEEASISPWQKFFPGVAKRGAEKHQPQKEILDHLMIKKLFLETFVDKEQTLGIKDEFFKELKRYMEDLAPVRRIGLEGEGLESLPKVDEQGTEYLLFIHGEEVPGYSTIEDFVSRKPEKFEQIIINYIFEDPSMESEKSHGIRTRVRVSKQPSLTGGKQSERALQLKKYIDRSLALANSRNMSVVLKDPNAPDRFGPEGRELKVQDWWATKHLLQPEKIGPNSVKYSDLISAKFRPALLKSSQAQAEYVNVNLLELLNSGQWSITAPKGFKNLDPDDPIIRRLILQGPPKKGITIATHEGNTKKLTWHKDDKGNIIWKEILHAGEATGEGDLANFFAFQGHLEGTHWSDDLEKEIEKRSIGVIGHGGQMKGGIAMLPKDLWPKDHKPVNIIQDLFENPEDYGDRQHDKPQKLNSISRAVSVNKIPEEVRGEWSEFAIDKLPDMTASSAFYYGKWRHEEREELAKAIWDLMPEAIQGINYDHFKHPIFISVWKEFNNVYLKPNHLVAAQRMDFKKAIEGAELPDNYELSDDEVEDINKEIKNKFGDFSNEWRYRTIDSAISNKVKYGGKGGGLGQEEEGKKRREREAGEDLGVGQDVVSPRMTGGQAVEVGSSQGMSGKILDGRKNNKAINLSQSYYIGYNEGKNFARMSQRSTEAFDPNWLTNINQKPVTNSERHLVENLGQFDGVADGLLEAFSAAIQATPPDADYISGIKPIHEAFKKIIKDQDGNILSGLQSLGDLVSVTDEVDESYLEDRTTFNAFEALLRREWRKINTNEELMKRISAIEKEHPVGQVATVAQSNNPFLQSHGKIKKGLHNILERLTSLNLQQDTTTEVNVEGKKMSVRDLIDLFTRQSESLIKIIDDINTHFENFTVRGATKQEALSEKELKTRLFTLEEYANKIVDLIEPLTINSMSAGHLYSAFDRLEKDIVIVREGLKRGELKTAHYNPAKAGLISFSEWKLAYV